MEPESINQNYTLEAEVLTPVHIGAGSEKDWLENADFILDKGKVYLLDHAKVIDAIGPEMFAHALTAQNKLGLRNILPGKIENYASKVLSCEASTNNEIKAQIKAGMNNKPIIPGSSLKGALRSILINHLNPSKRITKDVELNNKIMGSPTRGDELGRFIKVTDATFEETKLSNTKIFNLTKRDNTVESGWKHERRGNTGSQFKATGFNTIYEVLSPGQNGLLDLKIASLPWKNLGPGSYYPKEKNIVAERIKNAERKKDVLDDIASLEQLEEAKTQIITAPLDNFFGIINNYTRIYLEKEIVFFEKFAQAEHTNKILEGLRALKDKIPVHNSYCVLRLAAGSGFHSITGDWKLESHEIDKLTTTTKEWKTISRGMYNGQKSAKTRKIAVSDGEFLLMGFIKLRKVTEEEIKLREEQERQKIEEERKRTEQEAKRREVERAREHNIQNLMDEADELVAKEQFEKALEKMDKVAEMSPDDVRLAGKREAIDNARNAYEKRLREEERRKAFEKEQLRKAEELKQRQEANIAKRKKEEQKVLENGLAILTNIKDFHEGRKSIEDFFMLKKEEIPESEKPYLKDFVQRMKQQKQKEWKKVNKRNWKLITKWVGKAEAQQWFEDLD